MARLRVGWLVVALIAATAASLAAQTWWDRSFGFRRMPPRFATSESFDGQFNFCRVMYESVRREPGGMGWWTDYPDSDINFSIRLSELTKTAVSRTPEGEPNHLVVRLTDPFLFQCPFVVIEDAGTAQFDPLEVIRLHEYLAKGGFMWVDDFWGTRAWDNWTREIGKVLPPAEYPIVEAPITHPLFHSLFELEELPQIPSIQFWRQSGGMTSERGPDSARPRATVIADASGRVLVLMTHNTDISDAWEREGEDPRFFYTFSVDGYAVGIDVLLHAMTH